MTSIVIAVLTYKRNERLPALVQQLARQAETSPLPTWVLVVDNNPEPAAEALVGALRRPAVRYVHEPEPGIAAGRNRALAWSVQADAIAFIDDDETPSELWLSSLLATADSTFAAGVTGPVVREYARPPTPLVHGMRRWDRVRRPTGSDVPAASSANLLLDLRFLRWAALSFDPEFGLSGGSDTLLTKQLIRRGGRLVWCDEAVVVDHVPPERLTPAWVVGRGRRVGNTHARVAMRLDDRLRTRLLLVMHGLGLQAWGVGTSLAGRARRLPELDGAGRWRRARGQGIVVGALGRTHYDYQRPSAPGSPTRR